MKLFDRIKNIIPLKTLLIAIIAGTASLISIATNVHFYIPGTNALSDSREIFNSLGAAITGPIGGFIIGTISCLISPSDELKLYIIFQHWMSAVWIGWAYKKLVYEKLTLPHLAWGWILLILVYYIPSYIPVYFINYFFFPEVYQSFVGGAIPPVEALLKLYEGWIPEIIFTTLYTTLVIVALPDSYRKPRWGATNREEKAQQKPGVIQTFWKKHFNRNYLAIRLSIWFILLFTIPLTFLSIFTRNYFLDYFLQAEAIQQRESVSRVVRMSTVSVQEFNGLYSIIDDINKTGTRTVIVTDENLKVIHGLPDNSASDKFTQLITHEIKSLIVAKKAGIYINTQLGSALAFHYLDSSKRYIISFSPPGKYSNDLESFADLITKNLGITLLIISMISGLIIWVLVGRPLKRLTLVTERIGQGDYDVTAKISDMTDEVLTLATSIDEMKENIKNSQYKLEESESKFRTLFETANDAIIIIDQGLMIDCNSKTAELFKRERNTVINRTVLDYSPETQSDGMSSKESAMQKISMAMDGIPQFFEWDLIKPDGTIFNTEISLNRIYLKDRYYIQAILRDITERKKNVRELIKARNDAVKSDRLKSEFLAQISHEIRTPLHLILSNLSVIREIHGEDAPANLKKYLDNTKLASDRMTRTIELIISMAELQVGAYNPKFSNFDVVKDVLVDLTNEFSLLAELKHLPLSLIVRTKDCLVRCDKNSLQSIISNLLDNAIKFTKDGKVEIVVEDCDDNCVLVKVADTGSGISKEYLPIIYDIFSQEEQGLARTFEGSGLGLAIAKRYCDNNRILISIDTEKGKGSTFALKIPRAL